jgi:DNA-binding transcriptional LysR family regulator
MIEGVTLGQLRAFVAAVDEGSFSAAGRKLGRTQSVVTQTIANLERQLGLKLFDRAARKPVIVGHAESLLADARRIVRDVHRLEARARSLVSGLESELSVVVDVMFPEASVTRAAGAFAKAFPHTALHLEFTAGLTSKMRERDNALSNGQWTPTRAAGERHHEVACFRCYVDLARIG